MSPIGRVFIVLNLILAGVFVGFAGTYLQKQHHWKTAHEAVSKEFTAAKSQWESDKNRLDQDLRNLDNAKTQRETELLATKNQLDRANEENQRLSAQLATMEGDVKALRSLAEASNTESKNAHEAARSAYQMAIADQKVKDEAIRAKDSAEEENRSLKNQIASLNETITGKDLQIASLNKDLGEKNLLVDVARQNGLLDSMAQPKLVGTVSAVQGKLVTIAVQDNPEKAELKVGYKFAIYDANGYKGEARVTDVDASKSIAFATMDITTGTVKQGDSASTRVGTH